ncbi:O-antigen ligase family protein [Fundicoccus culcitae]|uniref:O-antigen ligase family protein n=1 Tax=Fundicoccus culcitae TaxID=2969821 RepID=A0ABY5P520_9LACT|nr:O-antigen ligase family protein [Fundicoccus culcitae]UUX33851.1 O-antigen ligase family protein [Fundicoccus culcitae]
MKTYLILLVMSVFLGTEILAVNVSVAQLTIYRLLALGTIPLLIYQLGIKNKRLVLVANSHATYALICYVLWWLWAVISVLWAENLLGWLQAVFLMTIGIASIVALYFFVSSFQQWQRLIQAVWLMISGLVVWGYFEIVTNIYLLADIEKLDKYRTFDSQPWTRIPITIFSNQNDYATLLLAYLALCLILFNLTRSTWKRLIYLVMLFASMLLIYQSGSRMALLCLILFFVVYGLLHLKWNFQPKHYLLIVSLGLAMVVLVLFLQPNLLMHLLETLRTSTLRGVITGDEARINLWHNGLMFLVKSFGFGVGAGNIEYWMEHYAYLFTNDLVNIHNWWLEILVGYGLVSFVLYVSAYGLMIYKLLQIMRSKNVFYRPVAKSLVSFMLIFILASVTSSTNMFIEWHWVYFGLIISFIKLVEMQEGKAANKRLTSQYITINREKIEVIS